VARHHFADAVPLLTRCLSLAAADNGAEPQLTLAEALWQIGDDRPRARALAEEARAFYAHLGHRPGLARASRWLDEHPR
jgi:hypothetical protein